MTDYTPDRWVIAKIVTKESEVFYKVFGTWLGGYLSGDSWRMNSGITKVKLIDNHYEFYGNSGSMYKCHKDQTGMSSYTTSVANNIMENLEDSLGYSMEILSPEGLETYLTMQVNMPA